MQAKGRIFDAISEYQKSGRLRRASRFGFAGQIKVLYNRF